HSYCYEGGETISYTYVASDPSAVLNLRVDSGQIHPSSIAFPDSKFNVYDSDGSLLYSGNGDNGDLSGLSFQSGGESISFSYTAVPNIDCDNDFLPFPISPIDITVECASCVNPSVSYSVSSRCDSIAEHFQIRVDIEDMRTTAALDDPTDQGDDRKDGG